MGFYCMYDGFYRRKWGYLEEQVLSDIFDGQSGICYLSPVGSIASSGYLTVVEYCCQIPSKCAVPDISKNLNFSTFWPFPLVSALKWEYSKMSNLNRHFYQILNTFDQGVSKRTIVKVYWNMITSFYFFTVQPAASAQKKWAKSDIIREMDLAVTMLLHDNTDTENAL